MGMMHCEYCGYTMENGAGACPSCGARMVMQQDPVPEEPPSQDTSDSMMDTHSELLELKLPVKTYMVPSIICTILFLSPFGLAAFIYGILVKIRVNAGDRAGALKASKRAQVLMWIGYIVGVVIYYFIGRSRR